MDLHMTTVLPLVSAALAALVTWLVTWLVTARTAKRNVDVTLEGQAELKIAEFRQSWINELRDCMSEFQSIGTTPGQQPRENRDFYRLGTKIELMMNPQDENFESIQKLLYDYLQASDGEIHEKYGINSRYVELCQTILKTEWDTLKRDLRKGLA